MGTRRALLWSWLRLIAVVAFVSIGIPAAEADEEGGCSSAKDYACARTGVVYDKKCSQGTTGGCENCKKTGNPEDICFYGSGTTSAVGYQPASSEE